MGHCVGIEAALAAYKKTIKKTKLSGPTCFAPAIREVIKFSQAQKDKRRASKASALDICLLVRRHGGGGGGGGVEAQRPWLFAPRLRAGLLLLLLLLLVGGAR